MMVGMLAKSLFIKFVNGFGEDPQLTTNVLVMQPDIIAGSSVIGNAAANLASRFSIKDLLREFRAW